ncbi:hypothetical protein CA830_30115, partial [Burkholderia multivorans]
AGGTEAKRGGGNERNELFHFDSPAGAVIYALRSATAACASHGCNVAKTRAARIVHLLQIAIRRAAHGR